MQRRGGGDGGDSGGGDHAEGHGARRGFVRCVLRSDSFHDSIHAHNQEDAVFERPCKKKGISVTVRLGKTKDFLLCSLLFIVMGLLDPPYVLLLRSVRDGELCAPKQ